MSLQGFAVTAAGRNLFAKLTARSEPVEFTRVMFGTGKLADNADIFNVTELVTPLAEGTGTTPEYKDDTVSMILEFRSDLNGGLTETVWLNEYGLYARDPNGGEVLVCYGNLGDCPDSVLAFKNGQCTVRDYPISIVIGAVSDVSINFPAAAFVTWEDMSDKMDKENPTGTGTFSVSRDKDTSVGTYSFAFQGRAMGQRSYTMGGSAKQANCIALGYNAAAGGNQTSKANAIAIGVGANAENSNSTAIGTQARAGGEDVISIGPSAETTGPRAIVIGKSVHASGGAGNTVIGGSDAKAYGLNNTVIGSNAKSGTSSLNNSDSVALGYDATAYDSDSVAIGYSAVTGMDGANSSNAINTIAIGKNSLAKGNSAIAMGAEANTTQSYAVAIGPNAKGSGAYSVAVGSGATAAANSVAIGRSAIANRSSNINIGYGNSQGDAGGNCITIGRDNTALGLNSTSIILMGQSNQVGGMHGVAIGFNLQNNADGCMACGQYNANASGRFIVGNGLGGALSNCLRVTDTAVYAKGNYNTSGADYAEMFEWADGNPNNEDRVGRFVTLDGENISFAESEDVCILGIVSAAPSVCGDAASEDWQGRFERDIFGRFLFEDIEIPEETREIIDEETGETRIEIITPAHIRTWYKQNPNWNPEEEYIPREDRPEWDAVGLIGKLVMIDDGTAEINGYVKPSTGGIAAKSDKPTRFRVMARLDENHIKVLALCFERI